MPFNWIAAFRIIPWTDVIAAAPTVARTARDLWRGISKSRSVESEAGADGKAGEAAGGVPPTTEGELRALRAELAETRTQLLASTRMLAFACITLGVVCAILLLR
jgi:hypothetical protein